MSGSGGDVNPPARHSLVRFFSDRSPSFWVSIVLATISFIAIFTSAPYTHYGIVAHWGNAIGAAIFFGAIPLFVAWLIRRLRSASKVRWKRSAGSDVINRVADGEVANSTKETGKEISSPTEENEVLRSVKSSLEMTDLHPCIRDAALPRWQYGFYSDAVIEAAKALTASTQRKLRRWDLADDGLMQQAFSDDPPKPGSPRLRFIGDSATPTIRSRMRGARGLAQACYAGIRNTAAHQQNVGWTAGVALEYLAAFSILARWIDECEVYRID